MKSPRLADGPTQLATTRASPLSPTKMLLTNEEVSALVGLSPRKIRDAGAAGQFPQPVKIGSATRWRREEIEAWVQQLHAQR